MTTKDQNTPVAESTKLALRTGVRGGGAFPGAGGTNHNQSGSTLTVRTGVKAGDRGGVLNHNQSDAQSVRNAAQNATLRLRTGVRAGGAFPGAGGTNHNQSGSTLTVRTGVKAGDRGGVLNHSQSDAQSVRNAAQNATLSLRTGVRAGGAFPGAGAANHNQSVA